MESNSGDVMLHDDVDSARKKKAKKSKGYMEKI